MADNMLSTCWWSNFSYECLVGCRCLQVRSCMETKVLTSGGYFGSQSLFKSNDSIACVIPFKIIMSGRAGSSSMHQMLLNLT